MQLKTLAHGCACLLLAVLAPSCASKDPGAPIFFGRAPIGSVAEKPIDKVRLGDGKPKNNFSGRNTPTGANVPSLHPLDGHHEILSRFGPRGRRGNFHAGYDIRAEMRSPVYATAAGTVTEANGGGAYGKKIVIDHGNGFETTYAHLDEHKAKPGQEVRAGDLIALSGRSGNATTPHLHYEIRKNGKLVNPGDYLPAGQ